MGSDLSPSLQMAFGRHLNGLKFETITANGIEMALKGAQI
jgi:hypothetical protein